MSKRIVCIGRKINKDRLRHEIENIRRELKIIERHLDKDDDLQGLEIGLAMDEIIMALSRATDCYVIYSDGTKKQITLAEHFILSL